VSGPGRWRRAGAEHLGDQPVEPAGAHLGLDEPLGLGLERLGVGEGQAERLTCLLHGGPGASGVPDRYRRHPRAQRGGLGVGADHPHRGHQDAEGAGPVVTVQGGDVEVDPVGPGDAQLAGQPHGDEHLPAAAQRPGGVEGGAADVGQRVQELRVRLVLQRLVAGPDDAERLRAAGERVGPDRRVAGCGDSAHSVGVDDVSRQRHRADVPAAQVAQPHGLLGGECLAGDGGAEPVPRVGAGEYRGRLRAVGFDLMCHERSPFTLVGCQLVRA
jgi:hypothetical protein